MGELKKRVNKFISEVWQVHQEGVRAQMKRCVREVHVNGEVVVYGFVCAQWESTVATLQSLRLPVHLLLQRASWHEVTAADIAALEDRVKHDVVLRLRLLDVCAARDPECATGQAWLTDWLQHVPACTAPRSYPAQGKVESLFLSCAADAPEAAQRHLFGVMHLFLLASAGTDTFTPLLVSPMPPPQSLPAELVDALASLWSCHPAEVLVRVSATVQQPLSSLSALAALLPPSSCTTLDAFLHHARPAATPALQSPPARPQTPPSPSPDEAEVWIRMTEQSALFPPMYLGPAGQVSFKLSDE